MNTIGLLQYADIINANIEISRPHNNVWFARFGYCEEIDGCMLIGVCGSGPSPRTAVEDFIAQICGKRLVFNAMSESNRREFDVPEFLDIGELWV